MSEAICRDEGRFTAKVLGAVPGAPFTVTTTHFISAQAGRGGTARRGAEVRAGSESDDAY